MNLLEPTLGFEPRTCCLRNSCSTAELCRRRAIIGAVANLTAHTPPRLKPARLGYTKPRPGPGSGRSATCGSAQGAELRHPPLSGDDGAMPTLLRRPVALLLAV